MLKLQTIDQELTHVVQESLAQAFPEILPVDFKASVFRTSDPRHGDYQCNDCMQLAKALRQAPRGIAEKAVAELEGHPALEKVELAGPGFINFTLSTDWLAERVTQLESDENPSNRGR